MSSNTTPDNAPVVLMPELLPDIRKPPRPRRFFIKIFCIAVIFCVCAGALWFWRHNQPVRLESEVVGGAEIWVRAAREAEVAEVFVKPGQKVIKDEPLLRFQIENNEIVKTEALAMLALLRGEPASEMVEHLEEKLRAAERAAEKEMQKRSTELSRAVYERRKLEMSAGAKGALPARLERARKNEAQAHAAYKKATEHFEDMRQNREESLAYLKSAARDMESMTSEERRRMVSAYQKKAMEADNALNDLFLRSPVKGIVLDSRVAAGMRAYPFFDLLAIAPEENAVFSCRAFVDFKTAEKIAPGAYCEALFAETDAPYPGKVRAVRDAGGEESSGQELPFAVIMEFSGQYETMASRFHVGMPVTVLVYKKNAQEKQ